MLLLRRESDASAAEEEGVPGGRERAPSLSVRGCILVIYMVTGGRGTVIHLTGDGGGGRST